MYYSIGETIKQGVSLLYTKIIWPKARLVRLPVYARTKANIQYGEGFTTGYACRIAAVKESGISFGENVILGDYVQIQSSRSIEIGDSVLIASKVFIGDSNHGRYSGDSQSDPLIPPNERPLDSGAIKIGSNVWIGNGVSIVGSLSIGDGAIIGANSVVINDIDAYSIYAGVPAKKIKQWNPETKEWERSKDGFER